MYKKIIFAHSILRQQNCLIQKSQYDNTLMHHNRNDKEEIHMHNTYRNLADLLLNCESAQKFYNNLSLHSKLEIKEKGSHLQTESDLRSLAKVISEQ